jgi:hypothetical protein
MTANGHQIMDHLSGFKPFSIELKGCKKGEEMNQIIKK